MKEKCVFHVFWEIFKNTSCWMFSSASHRKVLILSGMISSVA